MSAFNVLPSGVNTFFPTFWKHPDALFKKRLVVGGVSTPEQSGWWHRCPTIMQFILHALSALSEALTPLKHTGPWETLFPILLLESVVNFSWQDAVIQTVRQWIRRQPQAFFEKGIRMLPQRWKKCIDSGGEYVEDWHVQASVGNYGLKKKISPGHIWTTLYMSNIILVTCHHKHTKHLVACDNSHIECCHYSLLPQLTLAVKPHTNMSVNSVTVKTCERKYRHKKEKLSLSTPRRH